MNVKIVNQSGHALPEYSTPNSAGMDLRAKLDQAKTLKPMERSLIPTGLFMELPEGSLNATLARQEKLAKEVLDDAEQSAEDAEDHARLKEEAIIASPPSTTTPKTTSPSTINPSSPTDEPVATHTTTDAPQSPVDAPSSEPEVVYQQVQHALQLLWPHQGTVRGRARHGEGCIAQLICQVGDKFSLLGGAIVLVVAILHQKRSEVWTPQDGSQHRDVGLERIQGVRI